MSVTSWWMICTGSPMRTPRIMRPHWATPARSGWLRTRRTGTREPAPPSPAPSGCSLSSPAPKTVRSNLCEGFMLSTLRLQGVCFFFCLKCWKYCLLLYFKKYQLGYFSHFIQKLSNGFRPVAHVRFIQRFPILGNLWRLPFRGFYMALNKSLLYDCMYLSPHVKVIRAL